MSCANYPSQFMAGIKELQLAVNGKSLTVEKCRDLSWFGPLFSSGHVGLHSQKVWPILDSSTVQRSSPVVCPQNIGSKHCVPHFVQGPVKEK